MLLALVLLLALAPAAMAQNEQAPEGLSLRLYQNGEFVGPYLTELDHGYCTTKTYGVFLDGERQHAITAADSEYYTAAVENDLLTLTINSMDSGWPIIIKNGEQNELDRIFFQYAENQTHQFTYESKEYTLVFGPERGRNPVHVADFWFGMDTSQSYQGMIAAVFENYGDTEKQRPAPKEIQELMTSVSLSITEDDNDCMDAEQAVQQPDGWWLGSALVSAKRVPGDGYVTAEIILNGEKITLKAAGRIFQRETKKLTHEAAGRPAENMVSLQTMVDGLELHGDEAVLTLTPGAVYEGTLTINTQGLNGLTIRGGVDSNLTPTVIRGGIILETPITAIENLCFAAPVNGEEPTVAVTHGSPNAAAWWISDCAFLGYTVAVDCNENGYSLPTHRNLFVNNKTAVRIACGETNMLEPNSEMSGNVFLYNDVAVEIASLPNTIARHEFRIRQCDFINNKTDFAVPNGEHPYYFHENYFGDTAGNHKANARGAVSLGKAVHEIRQINPVSSRWSADTCWWQAVKLNNGILFHAQRPALLSDSSTDNILVQTLNDLNYKLEIEQGGGLTILGDTEKTELLNADAERLTVGSEALDQVAVQVNDLTDGAETVLGTWVFD